MGEKGERLHHRRRRPNSVMQRLAPPSSFKNSGATKWLYLLPSARLDRSQEPLFLAHRRTVGPIDWMVRTYTQVRPEELAGKLACPPPPATQRDTTTPTATNLAHAMRNISDRAAKRILQRRGRGGWAVVGGIHLRGGALTALAPSQVQNKDGENVENVLFIFFSTFAQCGKRSALLNGRPTDLFFTLYSLHAQSCQVLPHQHLTAMQRDK